MDALLQKHWHHLPQHEVVELLGTHPQNGLDLFEVKHRQEHFGPNRLTPPKGKSPVVRFLLQFNNPLVIILIAAGLVTAILKDPIDALVIFGVVIINAAVGFIQEMNAEQSIAALAKSITSEATVIRSGKTLRIPSTELVPGDMVTLQSGVRVPADLRPLSSRDLQITEAALTGESVPVEKDAEASLPLETVLADRRNMAYTSTLVTFGTGSGVVIATGDRTEIGRISHLISTAIELETPLTRKLAAFSKVLLVAILVLAAGTFLIGTLRGQSWTDMLFASIALAVGAIPEGLPAAVTVILAIGVSRMARRKAIIRHLPAVETLGSTTVICSDKTGTLTQNQMTVQELSTLSGLYYLSGTGYQPVGQISGEWQNDAAALETLKAGLLCNDSQLVEEDGRWAVQGDPTEGALLTAAYKAGLMGERCTQEARLDAIPFDSQHQYMATLHSSGTVYLKGSLEVVLKKCAHALGADGSLIPLDLARVKRSMEDMAEHGLRVLAFACKQIPGADKIRHQDIEGLTFLGLQGMMDPPRPEAIQAVRICQEAGITVKMITGDHALTAAAIARQIGLAKTEEECVLTGAELAELSDAELIRLAHERNVFARVAPEQKLRLVDALQAHGHVVAMTGDGVNDAPALKQANIGVAMDITGTDVAKEAADMILTDDNFATIEATVEEGRGVFDNLTKFIVWTLPTNLGEGLVLLAAILAGVTLPILPLQILWINMITAAILGTTLALEPKEPDLMKRPPRDPQAPLLTGTLIGRIVLVGLIILAGAFGLFEYELARGATLAEARTVAVNVVVFVELFYLFNSRSLTRSPFQLGLLTNPWTIVGAVLMVLLQVIFTYLPIMNTLFQSAPLPLMLWLDVLGVGLAAFILIELEKWLRRKFLLE